MANSNLLEGIRFRELLKSLSALELLLVAVWCILGLVYKLVSAGFQLLEHVLAKSTNLQGPPRGAPTCVEVQLEESASKVDPRAHERESSGSGAVRKKWRQVANYIPNPPSDDNRVPATAYNREIPTTTEACILCPGTCVCREYLTAEMWQARMSSMGKKARVIDRR